MAVSIQRGTATIAAFSTSIVAAISAVDLSKTLVVWSARGQGDQTQDGNAWDNQFVVRKNSPTQIQFERYGTTGAFTIEWVVIENDDFSVQEIAGGSPTAAQDDRAISSVDVSMSFVVTSMRKQESRDDDSYGRSYLPSSTVVRLETLNGIDPGGFAPGEWRHQVVELLNAGASVQTALFNDENANADQAIASVDPARSFVIGSSAFRGAGAWDNDDLFRCRLGTSGTQVEIRRRNQSGDGCMLAVHAIESPRVSKQRAELQLNTGVLSDTEAFSAPTVAANTHSLLGATYNLNQTGGGSAGPNSGGCTVELDAPRTTMTLQRDEGEADCIAELQWIEWSDSDFPSGSIPNAPWFGIS